MNRLIERVNDLSIIERIITDILKLNDYSHEQFWSEKYSNLWFRAKELNRRKPVSEWVITPPTQIEIYSEIYRDRRNNLTRRYFTHDDYKFMVFLHGYLNYQNDCEFINYLKTLTKRLENLEISLEGNGKLNKEEIFIFEEGIGQKRWLTLI